MKEVIVYILIAISDGAYNRGQVVDVAKFGSLEKCHAVIKQIETDQAELSCVKAEILVED